MLLKRLILQNFRSYESFNLKLDPKITYIVGPNTAGKSNLIEAIYFLSSGKSFRTESDGEVIKLDENLTRIKGGIVNQDGEATLEVTIADGSIAQRSGLIKKYLVNNLPKRRTDFSGSLATLLFEPSDLDIVSGSPGLRRDFLDEVLTQTDREYRQNLLTYTKAIRQRNALLQKTRELGVRNEREFGYWDGVVIESGISITKKRGDFISYLNKKTKELFLLQIRYDPSLISEERLLQYKEAEAASGVTLVGPHRDDFLLMMKKDFEEGLLLKSYGSRGQQRLGVLQLKLLQLEYMREVLAEPPVLLLDDIFSELDEGHIKHLLEVIDKQQTIITTTHKEFIVSNGLSADNTIELGVV